MTINFQRKLNKFISDRPEKFGNVTSEQKMKWLAAIEKSVNAMVNDSDIFYDNKPDDVDDTYKSRRLNYMEIVVKRTGNDEEKEEYDSDEHCGDCGD